MLAALLDSEMVVLDATHARVLLLDARTHKIWRACTGLTGEEIAAALGHAPAAVMSSLRELAEARLVTSDRDRWTRAPVTWV